MFLFCPISSYKQYKKTQKNVNVSQGFGPHWILWHVAPPLASMNYPVYGFYKMQDVLYHVEITALPCFLLWTTISTSTQTFLIVLNSRGFAGHCSSTDSLKWSLNQIVKIQALSQGGLLGWTCASGCWTNWVQMFRCTVQFNILNRSPNVD